jgi:hypothetical protein
MLRKALTLTLAAGLAMGGLPVMAQEFAPNTLWGEVPASASSAATAVLLDATDYAVATVPVVNGRFSFESVPPGSYSVVLKGPTGPVLTRSHTAAMASNAVVKVLFDQQLPAAAATGGGGGGGLGTTGWILIGAGAAGIVTAIVILSDDDQGVASPIL